MTLSKNLISTSALAMLIFTATPARADHRGGGHSHSSSAARSGPRGATTHADHQRSPRPGRSGAPRAFAPTSRVAVGRRDLSGGLRASSTWRVAPRVLVGARGVGGVRGFVGSGLVAAPYRFSRPYYAFRPRLSLGFGIFAGYPVAYPYEDPYYAAAYPAPYADPSSVYAQPYYGAPAPYTPPVYPPAPSDPAPGYPSYGSVAPSPSPTAPAFTSSPGYAESGDPPSAVGPAGAPQGAAGSGGASFEISPATAVISVDGTDVGTVADFGPTAQPLALTPGHHHLEVRAAGYQTIVVETDVKPGEVTPYQGTMQAAPR